MCGIAGQYRHDSNPVDRSTVERMCDAIVHRGPDSGGVHAAGRVGLGIRRLRIIDLDTGDQPISNEDGSVVVVLNGEIYNYRELRDGLAKRGHTFRTKSDTEVIVHLYEELGPDCVAELHGMFAFALWDSKRSRLMLARDRLGKKPLYVHATERRLSFASELAALLQDATVPNEPDLEAIGAFLRFKYVPSPATGFAGVEQLPPAHLLVAESGEVTTRRYWRPAFGTAEFIERVDAEGHVRALIGAAVERRLVSDVPIGAFLSGGIDSSVVVAAMAERSTHPVKTFTIAFEGDPEPETPLARLTAECFETDHHEITVRPDAAEILPGLVRHYGQPFADTSAVPSWFVSAAAAESVTVALNGDGGDESFAGYAHYQGALRTSDAVARIPRSLGGLVSAVGARLPLREQADHPLSRARRLAARVRLDDAGRYEEAVSLFGAAELNGLVSAGLGEALSAGPSAVERAWADATATEELNRMLEVDLHTYLPGDLLVKMDIASMAHSLETRSPLLDHELVAFAASLPSALKLGDGQTKSLLRSALRGWIPDAILDAPKRGFGLTTMGSWMRGPLGEMTADVLSDPTTVGRGYFNQSFIERLLEAHASGSVDYGDQLWALIFLEQWHREFIDRRPVL